MSLEYIGCLLYQCYSVSQEQHSLYPVTPHHEIAESNRGASLTRACCHDYECFTLVIFFKGVPNPTDRTLLIETLNDFLVDFSVPHRGPRGSPLNKALQFILLIEALDAARRIIAVVPNPVLISIAIENDRAPAESLL